MQYLVSAKDWLIHFKILHRVYLTPQRLHKIYSSHSSQCWRSTAHPAKFFTCVLGLYRTGMRLFWSKISQYICSVTTISVPLSIDVCILGLLNLLATSGAMGTLIGLLLFYALFYTPLMEIFAGPYFRLQEVCCQQNDTIVEIHIQI